MTTHRVTYQPIKIVQNLPFEIIAVPKDNDYLQPNTLQNCTNQKFDSFKIRIKNKKEPGVKRAVISVPKLSTSHSKKVRLVNSDQTILSFDLFIETPGSKITQKNQKKIFQIFKPRCLNAQNEDDNDPYTSTSSNGQEKNQNICDNNTNNRNENGAEKFALKKNFVPNNTTTKPHRSFLGQCKPGGCLDPPYNEDKYHYKPTDDISPLSLDADIDKKINQDGKFKNRDEVKAIITSEIERITNYTTSKKVVSSQLRAEENDDNMLNSLITYPHGIPSGKINIRRENQNDNTKPRTSSESKPKFLVKEFPEVYYMPPKKSKIKRSEAKYTNYENKTPSDESKMLNFLINNEVITSKPPVENILPSLEPTKDDNQLECKNSKETSQQIKKLFHYSPERKTITSNEDNHLPGKKSCIELVPVVEDRKCTTKTLSPNSLIKYFENPGTSDDINKTRVLPDKQDTDISELNNLINILGKSSETQIKTNSKDLYVRDSNISLKTNEVPSSNKQFIHELVDRTPISSSSLTSNNDKIELDSKHINVLYEDGKLFDVSLKTSLESLESQIDSRLEINRNDLSAISKTDKNNQVNVFMPILNNTDKEQLIKPEITTEHTIENNLINDSKQAIDEVSFTKQTRSLNKLQEKLIGTSLNVDNSAPDTDIAVAPNINQISKSRLRQDSTEMGSVINNDKIKQLQCSQKSFQESSKEIHNLSSSLDTLAKKSEEKVPSNITSTGVNSIFVRTEPNETPKIDTQSVHSIKNSAMEIKHSSRDFMKLNNSVLNSALNSPFKDSDTKIHFESDYIHKTDLEADILKDLNNKENDLKGTSNTNEKTSTQQSSDTKSTSLESCTIAKSKQQDLNEIYFDDINNNYAKFIERNMVQSQSFDNQHKTNVRIFNKSITNSHISPKILLSQSMETLERLSSNDRNNKSPVKENGKNGTITGISKDFPILFQLKKESNDVESLKIKHKYFQNISQQISLLEKNKTPSQSSVHEIKAQSKEKTVVSNIISTVPKVLIDGNNVTDDKVKYKKVEKTNEEKLNEIRDESYYFATKDLIDLQVAEKKISFEYEGQPNVSYTQPHNKTAINLRSRAAKSEDKAFIQTYELAMPIKENLEERATIKSLIRESNEEIRIHINSETDLTLYITKNKIPTKKVTSMAIVEEEKYIPKTSSSDKMLKNDTLLQETLNSVYDSLVPLQEIISNLTKEVKLLSQQQMLLGQLLSKTETTPLLNTHQICKCNKK